MIFRFCPHCGRERLCALSRDRYGCIACGQVLSITQLDATAPSAAEGLPLMRSRDELQMAHDKLLAVIAGTIPTHTTEDDRLKLADLCGVLCWALHHDHNTDLEKQLAAIDVCAASANMVMQRSDQPFTSKERQARHD